MERKTAMVEMLNRFYESHPNIYGAIFAIIVLAAFGICGGIETGMIL